MSVQSKTKVHWHISGLKLHKGYSLISKTWLIHFHQTFLLVLHKLAKLLETKSVRATLRFVRVNLSKWKLNILLIQKPGKKSLKLGSKIFISSWLKLGCLKPKFTSWKCPVKKEPTTASGQLILSLTILLAKVNYWG